MKYKCEDFSPMERVAYIPTHAHGDIKHKDVEYGKVSSQNGKYVFVKYDHAVSRLSWNGATSQATLPEDLVKV